MKRAHLRLTPSTLFPPGALRLAALAGWTAAERESCLTDDEREPQLRKDALAFRDAALRESSVETTT